MNSIARADSATREELFRATAQQVKLNSAMVEKDFWICWTLDYLFGTSPFRGQIAFKGGTSLSKIYGLIERMSEDIDVIIDWRLLGYALDGPWEERSNKKQKAFIEEIRTHAADFLSNTVMPRMQHDFESIGLSDFGLSIYSGDPQTILFAYPQSFADDALLQEIRIEAGAMSAWTPAEVSSATAYAAQVFPDQFSKPSFDVRTVLPERTFWEKVTILHKEAFRGTERVSSRYSRHYYDVYKMARSDVKDKAFADLGLLSKVVGFNQRFYRSAFAHYDLAKPGTLQLIPPKETMAVLEADYAAMRPMVYGEYPAFSEIVSALRTLEFEINSLC